MALKLITEPAAEPVTLAEAKAHLRVVDDDDDLLIGAAIKAARRHSERWMGRTLITQTWELVIDEFPDSEIKIPNPPLIAVESIKYDDADGVEQTLDAASYEVDTASEPGWVVPVDDWPSTIEGINAVRIRYIAGYTATADSPSDLASGVPFDIKAAILLYVGNLYAHRETIAIGVSATSLPWGAEQLLRMHRVDLSLA